MKRYYVGVGKDQSSAGPWFGTPRKGVHNWQNFVVCKTIPHALAQFKRLPVRGRQIDIRGDGPPRCWLRGREVPVHCNSEEK
jgi:hypothetical protein